MFRKRIGLAIYPPPRTCARADFERSTEVGMVAYGGLARVLVRERQQARKGGAVGL